VSGRWRTFWDVTFWTVIVVLIATGYAMIGLAAYLYALRHSA
jgi:hypothetical protein